MTGITYYLRKIPLLRFSAEARKDAPFARLWAGSAWRAGGSPVRQAQGTLGAASLNETFWKSGCPGPALRISSVIRLSPFQTR